jgi:Cft2 family RNA processing exonuclease
MAFTLTDLNPAGAIGANGHLLEMGPFRIIVDSGLHPKLVGREAMPAIHTTRGIPIDLIVLTHAHLDHVGSLPVVMREHPEALLLLSKPSETLAPRMLRNSYNVMLRQKEEQGIAEYPLFTRADIGKMKPRTFALEYGQPRFFGSHTGERMTVTLHRAGHVPGAAGVSFEFGHQRIFFTGDVLFSPQRILPAAKFPRDPVDVLVLETTRGLTERPPGQTRDTEIQRLVATIAKTLRADGSVLIPAFAFGRMQEVLTILHDAVEAGQLPKVPVFASGLGLDLCDYFDEIRRKTGEVHFSRRTLKALRVQKVPDHMRPGRPPSRPGIYVLSSGMIVPNTASYIASAALLNDPRSTLCFVGYCDPDSAGGDILAAEEDGEVVFDAFDFKTRAKAQILKFDLSSHADREELLEFALAVRPRTVVLTHGDPGAREWFSRQIQMAAPKTQVIDPTPLRPIALG